MDWKNWESNVEMTLCFIISEGRVLLIRKKRGLGKGKVNAPGGKIEEGEDPLESVKREVEEEVGVVPKEPEKVAELMFENVGGRNLLVHVFVSEGFEGEVKETDEASPFWVGLDEIPYSEMWEDDRIWLPEVLSGTPIRFWARFDGEKMVEWEMEEA